jgi:hypothetical protein
MKPNERAKAGIILKIDATPLAYVKVESFILRMNMIDPPRAPNKKFFKMMKFCAVASNLKMKEKQ